MGWLKYFERSSKNRYKSLCSHFVSLKYKMTSSFGYCFNANQHTTPKPYSRLLLLSRSFVYPHLHFNISDGEHPSASHMATNWRTEGIRSPDSKREIWSWEIPVNCSSVSWDILRCARIVEIFHPMTAGKSFISIPPRNCHARIPLQVLKNPECGRPFRGFPVV